MTRCDEFRTVVDPIPKLDVPRNDLAVFVRDAQPVDGSVNPADVLLEQLHRSSMAVRRGQVRNLRITRDQV
ncbi:MULTISPECIES: hypothetical protein [unclassified Rhodococcus (in: high G+C Gram-positive bacteria)]|uniref:hypothetical protein n=1 Tax=unclassified Rhodococcus (in: high G+C Gram-positive bacteria) TaxID=192944 RepID=UPI001ED8C58C|nr:hypothetical protein [Rhodococcus sp. DK17]